LPAISDRQHDRKDRVDRAQPPWRLHFEAKLNDAQGGGAIAAVIYTTIDRPLISMNVGAATLPALMISNVDGVAIKHRLAADTLIARMDFTIASVPSSSDGVADFSSRGPNVNGAIKPDLVAVGTDFYTATERTVATGEMYNSTGYVITDGTSFSAPLVAGAAALLKGARPGLTAAQYRSLLINTAAPITARVQEAGAGLLDMNAALQSTFAIAPTSLSLGIGAANPNLSKTLTISNIGTSAESYSLTVAPRNAGAPAPALGVSTVTVQPGQSASVPITFSGSGLTAGQYEGFLKIRGTVADIEERVPYWYGVASNVPATITPLYVKGKDDFPTKYKAGTRVNNAIYFRVIDASGIIIANAQPTVTAFSGGGSVISTISVDRSFPGVFSVSVQLGVPGGDNVFRIKVGNLEPLEVTITGNVDITPPSCSYALSSNGQPIGGRAFGSGTGSGSFAVTATPGCAWSASGMPTWLTSTSSGMGAGNVSYQVQANYGAERSGAITVGDQTYTVEQANGLITSPLRVGSFAHVASAGTWKFTLTEINLGTSVGLGRLNLFSESGAGLTLPWTFPQSAGTARAADPLFAESLDRTMNPNAQVVMESTGPDNVAPLIGLGTLTSSDKISAFGIFSNSTFHWDAVVPLETRNATSYHLAFDNTGALATGVAVSALEQPAAIGVIIRDDAGAQIGTDTIHLPAQGHISFMLNAQYPVTRGKRGSIEFDRPPAGQISVLGLRVNGAALTTLPVLASLGTGGGSISHVTYNGGFTSVFYLVNMGISSSPFVLTFFAENGSPLSVPLSFPQTGTATTTSQLTSTIAPGAMLVVETQAQDLPGVSGSAQLAATGAVGAFEIFRSNSSGQEASVPLEARTPASFVLVFDNTGALTTGVALANVAGSAASIKVIIRDDTGVQIGTDTINLAARGHTSFLLPDKYLAAAKKRGMVEFIVPSGGQISVVGLRAKSDGTLTTIPVLTK
jgi:hypothetical protein